MSTRSEREKMLAGDVYTVAGRIWSGDRVLMTGTGVYKGIRSIRRKAGYREAQE